jgi:hypothetical protein
MQDEEETRETILPVRTGPKVFYYRDILIEHLLKHRYFYTLPRDLRFQIQSNSLALDAPTLIAVENYLIHLYPLGYRLQDSVDIMLNDIMEDRPFIIHSG